MTNRGRIDNTSRFFIVVSAVTTRDQDTLRQELLKIEDMAGTHALKWNKSRHDRRMKYISLVLEQKIAAGYVFIGRYPKPVPYFYPVASVNEQDSKILFEKALRSGYLVEVTT